MPFTRHARFSASWWISSFPVRSSCRSSKAKTPCSGTAISWARPTRRKRRRVRSANCTRIRSAKTRCMVRMLPRPRRSKSPSFSPVTKSSVNPPEDAASKAARTAKWLGEFSVNWLLQIFDPATIGTIVSQFHTEMTQPAFWVAVGKIIWINVLLSGDNALVIALACRGLEPRHRLWGMILGAGAAVVLRIFFTGIVASLMELPYLKLAGGLALLVIAAKLLVPEHEEEGGVESASHLWAAIQIVVIADVVMSLDNVIAVAAAANGSIPLLILGLAISIPLIVAGAALIMALLSRLPILVWAGAALLGWIAGDVIATDPAVSPALHRLFDGPTGAGLDSLFARLGIAPGHGGEIVCGVIGVVVVLVAGMCWRKRRLRHAEQPL